MGQAICTTLRMLLISLMCVSLFACGSDSSNEGEDGETYSRQAIQKDYGNLQDSEQLIARVKLLSDGKLLLDDKETSLDDLRLALAEIRKNSGAVWFYRESVSEASKDEGIAVMDIILDEGLPTRFSTQPDFSDSAPPFEF